MSSLELRRQGGLSVIKVTVSHLPDTFKDFESLETRLRTYLIGSRQLPAINQYHQVIVDFPASRRGQWEKDYVQVEIFGDTVRTGKHLTQDEVLKVIQDICQTVHQYVRWKGLRCAAWAIVPESSFTYDIGPRE